MSENTRERTADEQATMDEIASNIPTTSELFAGVNDLNFAQQIAQRELDARAKPAQPTEGEDEHKREDSEPDAGHTHEVIKQIDDLLKAPIEGTPIEGTPIDRSKFTAQVDLESFERAAAQLGKDADGENIVMQSQLDHFMDMAQGETIHVPLPGRANVEAWRRLLQQHHAGVIDVGAHDDLELTDDAIEVCLASAHRVLDHLMAEAPSGDAFAQDIAAVCALAIHYANLDEASTKKGRAARRDRKAVRGPIAPPPELGTVRARVSKIEDGRIELEAE